MKQEIWHGDCLELMKDIPKVMIPALTQALADFKV